MSNSTILDFVGESYDFGDLLAGMVGSFGIGSITGIADSSAYGVSFTDAALSLGGDAVSYAALAVLLSTLVSCVTNDGLSVKSLMNRPTWEKVAVGALVLGTVALSFNVAGIHDVVLQNYVNGTIAAGTMLTGYLIVAFRRANSAKKGLFTRVKA